MSVEPCRAYVLRCLPLERGAVERVAWRFSVQRADGEALRVAFDDLDGVITFLRMELDLPVDENQRDEPARP